MKSFFIILKSAIISCLIYMLSMQNIAAQDNAATEDARVLIKKHYTAMGISSAPLENARIADAYYDKLSGALLVYLQQTIDSIDVYNVIKTLAFKNNKLVSSTGSFIQQPQTIINSSRNITVLSAADAVKAAAAHLGLKTTGSFSYMPLKAEAAKETMFGKLGIADNNITAKLVWLYSAENRQINLCWQVQIQPAGKPDYWLVKVDAFKGQILGKDNLTIYDNRNDDCTDKEKYLFKNFENNYFKTGFEEKIEDDTSAKYRVIPFPAESPMHSGGTPAIRTNPWNLAPAGSNATTLQWNYNGTTYFDSTRGNNVLVQEDHNANNGFGEGAHSLTPAPVLLFDYKPDFTKEPADSINKGFAITNLFYWTNIIHDISYLYGFDEVSGNFQENNLGRGGKGNDYLLADAQDATSDNNANFNAPPDGINPRMQVFLFNGTPKRDGDLDNGIICHEYAHGISTRLTGGPSNSGCLTNKEQMGEGWSDYFALMITTNWATAQTTDGSKKRTIATYALNEPVTGQGWRRYPYSTDISADPETYSDLTKTGGEEHNIGELWATVLWDMTWEIIQSEGINPNIYDVNGAGGNSIALKLVTEGMKLQPCKPGFLDGRDAILKADTFLYNGKYSCAIWKAFAKRGMGLYAKQGSSDSYTDQIADFSIYSFPYIVNHVNKTSETEGETITYSIQVEAPHCEDISNYLVVDTLPGNVTYVSSDGIYSDADRTVKVNGINLVQGQSGSFKVKVKINDNSYSPPFKYISDSVKSTSVASVWKTTSTTASPWKTSSVKKHSAAYSYFAKDSSGNSNATLQTAIPYKLPGKSTLGFWHYYDIESGYDGGVLDISIDSGKTWQDLGPYITQNTYNGQLVSNTPLIGGRKAFTGTSNGSFIYTQVDLSAFSNKAVQIRFLLVSDESGDADGWYIDDINLKSEAAVFATAQLFDNNNKLVAVADTITKINDKVLPVTLLNFYGEVRGKQNVLHWTTITEQNNTGFEVQRSNSINNFSKIGFVKSKAINGNSNLILDYDFTDIGFTATNYYRLKQIDKDGKFNYSDIIILKDVASANKVELYPSPAKNSINLKIIAANNNHLKLSITDISGRTMYKKTALIGNGETVVQINVSNFAAGTYFVKLVSDNGNINRLVKFVKE